LVGSSEKERKGEVAGRGGNRVGAGPGEEEEKKKKGRGRGGG
jgi:hypothetical protein